MTRTSNPSSRRHLGVETRRHSHGLVAHASRREFLQQRLQEVERHRSGWWCVAGAQDRGLLEAHEIRPEPGDLVGDHHGTFGRPGGQNVLVGQRRGGDVVARSRGGDQFLEKRAHIQVLGHDPQAMIIVGRGWGRRQRQQGEGEKRRHLSKPPSPDGRAKCSAGRCFAHMRPSLALSAEAVGPTGYLRDGTAIEGSPQRPHGRMATGPSPCDRPVGFRIK